MIDQPHLDEAALAELRDVMEDDFGVLVDTFLADSQARLHRLHQLLEQDDSDQLAKTAHSFKGSCINMGATNLSELCAQLERAGKAADLSAAAGLLDRVETEFAEVASCFEQL